MLSVTTTQCDQKLDFNHWMLYIHNQLRDDKRRISEKSFLRSKKRVRKTTRKQGENLSHC